MLAQLITSFIASVGFGIIFNAPRRSLLQCGIAGMLGWMVYVLLYMHINPIVATLIATFIVGGISQIFARIYKTPIIIFSVAGVIPLVPGGLAYNSMRNFVENDYATATSLAAQAAMLSGSIALGLVLSEVFNQMIRRAAR
ncbi:threonine/serine exporter family protein [Paenibacillus campi]|uniref:threonine/serine exporter family protein n=1 Tax=Paenibacillus campi TaxID=3106031 RepID=UPI002AFDD48D|nr:MULTISPECIES: threonine/serine exporter family protein [unclassified Paenibacillus]